MSEAALAIYLDGPLQAWGVSSRFQHRDTERFPTKSALLGLIAAAMGLDKGSADEAAALVRLGALRMAAYLLGAQADYGMQRLVDYHTVGAGYDRTDPWQKLLIPRKASGGAISNAVLTNRTYLLDARFAVVLEGAADQLEAVGRALADPVWGVWLGRKCCLPSAPLYCVAEASRTEALDRLLRTVNERRQASDTPALALQDGIEEPSGEDAAQSGVWYWNDQPLSFGQRAFVGRPVRRTQR
ncbi:MAG: type I-E CRISPR-associated protein Cas5/CasD [Verrucomicrobiota bacterium JB022]|nr:type I-E CRISPR-associated protein Cas5/CasD [Verrucomicrobiota bacterium JB022]